MKKELNTVARDSLVNQISETMQEVDERIESIRVGLQYMINARSDCYTGSMEEIKTMLGIASKRFEEDFSDMQTKALNLAGVANQIYQGEMNGDENRKRCSDAAESEVLPETSSNGAASPKKRPAKKQLRVSRKRV